MSAAAEMLWKLTRVAEREVVIYDMNKPWIKTPVYTGRRKP